MMCLHMRKALNNDDKESSWGFLAKLLKVERPVN